MFPSILQSLAENIDTPGGYFEENVSLNVCTLVLLTNREILEHSEATTYCIFTETHKKYLFIFYYYPCLPHSLCCREHTKLLHLFMDLITQSMMNENMYITNG